MAKKVSVTLVDDTDNELIADETVSFGLDGVSYTIDLSELNAAKLRGVLDPWVKSATKISGRRKVATTTAKPDKGNLAGIREWAPKNGFDISPRGRVPANVVAAYEAAHA